MFDASAFYDPTLPWEGRAAMLRDKKAGVSLITELGRNYSSYHEALAHQLDALGRPVPERYATMRAFLEAWGEVQAIVRAEFLLRTARSMVLGQVPAPLTAQPPLVSEADKLVDISQPIAAGGVSP